MSRLRLGRRRRQLAGGAVLATVLAVIDRGETVDVRQACSRTAAKR